MTAGIYPRLPVCLLASHVSRGGKGGHEEESAVLCDSRQAVTPASFWWFVFFRKLKAHHDDGGYDGRHPLGIFRRHNSLFHSGKGGSNASTWKTNDARCLREQSGFGFRGAENHALRSPDTIFLVDLYNDWFSTNSTIEIGVNEWRKKKRDNELETLSSKYFGIFSLGWCIYY